MSDHRLVDNRLEMNAKSLAKIAANRSMQMGMMRVGDPTQPIENAVLLGIVSGLGWALEKFNQDKASPPLGRKHADEIIKEKYHYLKTLVKEDAIFPKEAKP